MKNVVALAYFFLIGNEIYVHGTHHQLLLVYYVILS